jgi:hypothetical protein
LDESAGQRETAECSAQIRSKIGLSAWCEKALLAPSESPAASSVGSHSPQITTKGCLPVAHLAASATISPTNLAQRTESITPFDHDVFERLRGIQGTVVAVLNDSTNLNTSGR